MNARSLPRARRWSAAMALAVLGTFVSCPRAAALITGGEGNSPMADPGWPQGAAAIFNHRGRIAYWVGPPFGGGQWHAECRGDAKSFNRVLAQFAQLDVKTKRLVVRDGLGHSFWLNPNREAAKEAPARVDWVFTVWQPANWERLSKAPASINPTDPKDAATGPPAQIDVYTGGKIRWSEVNVPEGIEVIDQRLEAHGFTTDDGAVLEGRVTDQAKKKPLPARVRLERVEPRKKGGYRYPAAAETVADNEGKWVIKNAPVGWARVVVEAEGYVPRIAGHVQLDGQPGWHSYDTNLSRPAEVSGRVVDDAGNPIAGVDVRLSDVAAKSDGRYESPLDYKTATDADGLFRFAKVPIATASIGLHKPGYCRPGLGPKIKTPVEDVELRMARSAQARVTVEFSAPRPEAYIVHIEPEGGSAVGTWGGSGQIDANNEIAFSDVPPGRYVLTGQPNPSTEGQRTKPLRVELKGGQSIDIRLRAR